MKRDGVISLTQWPQWPGDVWCAHLFPADDNIIPQSWWFIKKRGWLRSWSFLELSGSFWRWLCCCHWRGVAQGWTPHGEGQSVHTSVYVVSTFRLSSQINSNSHSWGICPIMTLPTQTTFQRSHCWTPCLVRPLSSLQWGWNTDMPRAYNKPCVFRV